jgi:hypothetical protein
VLVSVAIALITAAGGFAADFDAALRWYLHRTLLPPGPPARSHGGLGGDPYSGSLERPHRVGGSLRRDVSRRPPARAHCRTVARWWPLRVAGGSGRAYAVRFGFNPRLVPPTAPVAAGHGRTLPHEASRSFRNSFPLRRPRRGPGTAAGP